MICILTNILINHHYAQSNWISNLEERHHSFIHKGYTESNDNSQTYPNGTEILMNKVHSNVEIIYIVFNKSPKRENIKVVFYDQI